MDLKDQQLFLQLFHSTCLGITKTKGPDYAPDGIPLLDMVASCVENNTSVPQGLWTLYRKHFSAIRKHFFLGQPLTSEPIMQRLADAANYFGFLAFYETHKQDLFAAWAQHWIGQPCECEYVEKLGQRVHCQRCETLSWLDTQASMDGYALIWSDSTPRAQDSSPTGRPSTGATTRPRRSLSVSVIKKDEKLGYVGKLIPELERLSLGHDANKKP